MKLKALTLALFAAGLLTGLTLIAPATGADPPTTTSGSTTSGTTTVATTTTTTHTTTTTPTITTTPTTTTTPTNYTNATDPISALSSTSITVGPLTCSIGSSSPGTGDFKVGDRVRMYCSNGVLIYIKADTPTTTTTTTTPAPTTTTTPTTTSTNYTSATDAITALSSTSITVGQLTCTIGSSSPHTGDFRIGDRARIYCASGVLAYLIRPDAPTTTTAPTTNTTTTTASEHHDEHHDDVMTTRLGTISALNSTSITVDGLTCTIGSSSPSLSAFKLGDQVGIGCVNGVLAKIGTPQVDDGGFKVVVQLGSITALGTGSITVGNLTCSLATTSPTVTSYKVGDRVGVGCAGGILFMIGALPNTDSVSKTEVRHALVERFKGCIKRGSEKCTVNGILHRLVHK